MHRALAAVLALFTSLAYGLGNYVGPRLARDAPVFTLLLLGQACSLLLAAVLVVAGGEAAPTGHAIQYALLAGIGNAGGLVLFYRAAAAGPLSIVTPLGSLGVCVPLAVGVIDGEHIGALKACGIVLAIGGIVLAARRPAAVTSRPDVTETAAERHHGRAAILALASAAFFGVFLASMRPASRDGAAWAVMLSRLSLLTLLAAIVVATREPIRVASARLPRLAIPGLLLFAGTLAYSAATRRGDLSVVSVLGSLFPVVTVSLALGLDRERLSRTQALGVVGTLVGVVLLSAR